MRIACRSFPRLAAEALLTVLSIGLAGCSDDGLGKRYPVAGTVTYDGKPLASGSINFIPETAESRSATGMIVDGNYSLTTHKPGDGALPGKFKVTITSYAGDLAKVKADAEKAFDAKNAMPDQLAVGAAQKKSLIPERYGSFEGSGLSADVQERSNRIDFALKN